MAQFCIHCGIQLCDEGEFCHGCGKPRTGTATNIAVPAPVTDAAPKTASTSDLATPSEIADDINASISVRLQNVTQELRRIQDLLTSEENVDQRILTDFRDALNRVRNTAWAFEQYLNSKTMGIDSKPVISVLAGERIRIAYQLCRLVQADLANREIEFQKGQLLELRDATEETRRQLAAVLGE